MNVHSHYPDTASRRIGLVFFLNLTFTVVEFIGGVLTNSTAIIADAVHDLGDSLSLGSAWLLARWGLKSADGEFTYGYRRLTLFSAFINSVVLIAGSLWVLSEAIPRLVDPVMPHTEGMMALAVLGMTVNGIAAYRISKGTTLNEKVLNWHLLEDVLGWASVLIVSVVLQFADWPILDPLLSVGFTLFILINVIRNLWATGRLFLQAVPDQGVHDRILRTLLSVDGVSDVHHQHLWSLDGEHHVLTAHVILQNKVDADGYVAIKEAVATALEPFRLAHTTIEIELENESCRDSI
ncbi:cation diffusion facilitator family transporter [Alloalcanivorax xenomutans]|jgi:cobalt-zinc-cadmium efflux system protein|uniref:Cation diffusion facilitator family transporter n=1 Tax=Alloalcanivorax xenomutans TaxID=1094342 RepID=A0A9Q3W6G4_9GAMM|nr:cation diffusion facilitator family transporter [Alloalcanivorax xenomutans]MBA4721473.1 cation transporter [Alcanivorax sp.]MCE7509695.1 cation diffusion facilitator family transporter [Alloalcanivorax xenomutans]MCE7525269.1 cation diffusion facilitator family transporter [Alloalcanivorax xenomutans]CUR45111.1 Cobalt-zinc-cadmium resistance protein CzcD [Alloalcanivorax xenomutans]|tara:strand:- start:1958 stop:2839 length:882 start_codon:yes stop_codon:yes gene_type:complete